MDGLAWWASLLSTTGIRLNTAYLHTTRIEFIQCAGKSLFLAYSGRIMSFWFFFSPSACLASSQHWEFSSCENSFANSLMIGILRHDMRKWERIVPPCKSAFAPAAFPVREAKSPRSPQGCWPRGNRWKTSFSFRMQTRTLSFFQGCILILRKNILGLCIRLTCLNIHSWLTSHISCILRLFLVSYNDVDLACYAALFGFCFVCLAFCVMPCGIFDSLVCWVPIVSLGSCSDCLFYSCLFPISDALLVSTTYVCSCRAPCDVFCCHGIKR